MPNTNQTPTPPGSLQQPGSAATITSTEWESNRMEIENEVRLERLAQVQKWGEQSHDLGIWLAILSEEVGELAQAMLNWKFDDDNGGGGFVHRPKIQREATQIAAVASAIVQACRHGKA